MNRPVKKSAWARFWIRVWDWIRRGDTSKVWMLMPLVLCSCAIQKYNRPPEWASAVVHHSRFTGLDAAYQGVGIRFGWGSDVWTVIPVSTNKIHSAPITSTFKLGQGISPFSTTIIEDFHSGWEGQPPPPRLKFVVPVEKSLSTNDWPFLPWTTNLPPINR